MARKSIIAIAIAAAFLLLGWKAAWFVAGDDCLAPESGWEEQACDGFAALGLAPETPAQLAGLPAKPTGPLVDAADVLSEQEEKALSETLDAYNAVTRHPLAVATVNTTNGQEIGAFTDDVANNWDIGEEDRGVMVLIAVVDRKMRISVADGTLGVLPNERSAQIIREEMTPPLRSSQFYAALDAAVEAIAEATSRDAPGSR